MDEGWRSRISRSTQPGKILYTNPHQPSTWEKKPGYHHIFDLTSPISDNNSYPGDEASATSSNIDVSDVVANNLFLINTIKADQTEKMKVLRSDLIDTFKNEHKKQDEKVTKELAIKHELEMKAQRDNNELLQKQVINQWQTFLQFIP